MNTNKNEIYSNKQLWETEDEQNSLIELFDSHNIYRTVFHNSPLGILYFDKESNIVDCNEKLFKIFGTNRDTILKTNLLRDLQNIELKEQVSKTLKVGKGFFEGVFQYFRSNKQIPLIVRLNAIYSNQKKIVGGVALVEDNTKKFEIEKISKETEFYLKEAQKYSKIGNWKRNLLTNELHCSEELLCIYNIDDTECELPVEYFYSLIHPNDKKRVEAVFQNSLENKTEYEVTFRIEFPDGTTKYLNEKGKSEYDRNGTAISSLGIVQDITKIKRKELIQTALYKISIEASSNKSLAELYKSIHLIIKELMSADNFYICVFNEETNLLSFPYHVDEKDETPSPHPLGKGLSEYVLQTKKNAIITEELDKQLQAEGKVELSGEYTKIWVGIYLNFESNMKGVLVIQDYNDENAYGNEELEVLEYVSEQIVRAIDKKYTDEKLFLSEQRLLKSNMDKDKFFSIISHDLKSPFQGIMGMAELLNEDYALLEESEKQESLYLMDKSIKNVYALIEDLLEWARLQSGKMEFEPTNVDLKDVILKAISIAQITANNKNIVIKNEINSNSNVFVDKNMITTVIRNLLANAIKFSKECSEIIITSKNVDDKALLSITDSGIGMNENTINKLFKIDEHYTSIGTNGEKGTGLGLILCKELIEINRGSIWAESEFGKGSTFSFTMPLE